MIVFFIAYQQFENHVLQPLVYGRTVQLSPLAVLCAVLVGAQLAGILGALLAIPVAGSLLADRPRDPPVPRGNGGRARAADLTARRHPLTAPARSGHTARDRPVLGRSVVEKCAVVIVRLASGGVEYQYEATIPKVGDRYGREGESGFVTRVELTGADEATVTVGTSAPEFVAWEDLGATRHESTLAHP